MSPIPPFRARRGGFTFAADIVPLWTWEVLHWAGAETDADGAKVAQATDQSGTGLDATNATEDDRPYMRTTGLAGGPAYEFEALDYLEWLTEPDFGNTSTFVLIAEPAAVINAYAWGTTGGGDIPSVISGFGGKDFEYFGTNRADILTTAPAGATVIVGYFNGAGELVVRANGTEVINTTGESATHGAFNMTDFGSAITSTADWAAHIALVGLHLGQATLAQMKLIEEWAAGVYGISI